MRRILRQLHLLPLARRLRWALLPSERRKRAVAKRDLEAFAARCAAILVPPAIPIAPATRTALVTGLNDVIGAMQHALLIVALRRAGFEPVVILNSDDPLVRQSYACVGVRRFIILEEYLPSVSTDAIDQLLGTASNLKAVAGLSWKGVACGRYALSTLMRVTRRGRFSLADQTDRALIASALRRSCEFAEAAQRIVAEVRPDLGMFLDRGYTPTAELFDTAIAHDVSCVTWNTAHRDSTLMLKRYSRGNDSQHPCSLSMESWSQLKAMPWSEERWLAVRGELESCYRSGQWYSEVGTQFDTRILARDELLARLGLKPGKPLAVLFPHIFWDGTFFFGEDVFPSYEDWFVAAAKAACANSEVNWVIKVHPANLVKDRRDGLVREGNEVQALREQVGPLPGHVRLLDSNTDISTMSLFGVMDYCLTVRGTVGIEAACFGARVLTAGTGRFDRMGFTDDFTDRETYLAALANLHRQPPVPPDQLEIARRYAYGVFLARPLHLNSLHFGYARDATASLQVEWKAKSASELAQAEDLNQLTAWLAGSAEDYLAPAWVGGTSAMASKGG